MTSLVGFEALLRGLPVFTYGLPFYAGWGLTGDRHRVPRRTSTLTLDALTAGTLIAYPRYIHWATGEFTAPETVVSQLAARLHGDTPPPPIGGRGPKRWLTKLKNLLRRGAETLSGRIHSQG